MPTRRKDLTAQTTHYEGDGCVPAHFPGLTLLSPEAMGRLERGVCVTCGERPIDWIYMGAVLCAVCRKSPGEPSHAH